MTTRQSRDDPFRWLLDVAEAIVMSTGRDDALERVARAIGAAMDVTGIEIRSYDLEAGTLTGAAVWSPAPDVAAGVAPLQLSAATPVDADLTLQRVIARHEPVEVRTEDAGLGTAERAALAAAGAKTLLLAPMDIGGETVGVLCAAEARFSRAFMTVERERFAQLAGLAAAALRNQRMFHREQAQAKRLETLLLVSRALTAAGDVNEGLGAAGEALGRRFAATWVALWSATPPDGSPHHLLAWRPLRDDGSAPSDTAAAPTRIPARAEAPPWLLGPARDAMDPARRIVSVEDHGLDTALQAQMLDGGESLRLYVPLVSRDMTLGLLLFAWQRKHDAIDAAELPLLEAAAKLLAVTLENVALETSLL